MPQIYIQLGEFIFLYVLINLARTSWLTPFLVGINLLTIQSQLIFLVCFFFVQCIPTIFKVYGTIGDEQAIAEAHEQLQILENELAIKGNKFFGGDNINLVDIAADFIGCWLGVIEEVTEIKLVTKDKFPK